MKPTKFGTSFGGHPKSCINFYIFVSHQCFFAVYKKLEVDKRSFEVYFIKTSSLTCSGNKDIWTSFGTILQKLETKTIFYYKACEWFETGYSLE